MPRPRQFRAAPRQGETPVGMESAMRLAVLAVLALAAACAVRGDDDGLGGLDGDGLWASLLAEPEEGAMLNDAGQGDDGGEALWDALVGTTLTPPATSADLEQQGASSTPPSEEVVEVLAAPAGSAPPAEELGAAAAASPPPGPGQDPDPDPEAVSLAFVFDSTGSMWRDLEQLKRGAAAILSAMLARPDRPVRDYVFVPFNDPVVGPANVTTDPKIFRDQLEAVEVHGGSDCPEPSLTALLEALKLVRPNSYIYVFTDASAKDYNLLPDVLSLVQRKQTQVVFVMSGNCKDGNTPRYQSMENIAAASSGQVYHINKTEVENVLSFVRQTLESQKVNLISVDLPEAAKKEHAVEVDETLREFTISVSGENPVISVVNPEGIRIEKPPALQNILDLDNVKVVAVREPTRGSWTVETSSDSKHAVRLTGLSVVDFAYGFSAQLTNRLDETYHRPLQDAENFILVGGTDMGSVWNLTSVDLLAIDGSSLQTIPLLPLNAPDGLYRGGPFIPPEENILFYLANAGYGRDGFPIKRITPTAISAQAGGLPIIQLKAEQSVWINGSLSLRCQIDSLLPFTAWFFKDGVPISKKHKYQQTALMTMKINGLTEEMGGDYMCRASNVKGYNRDTVHVVVTGPPPEVMTESQLLIQPRQKVVLDCYIKSNLKVNVTWLRVLSSGDRELVENNARYIILPNSSLVIDPALSEDTGQFSCVVESQGGRRESNVQLHVYEPLQIRINPPKLNFQKGDSFSISCEANSLLSDFYWERDGQTLQKNMMGHVSVEKKGPRLVLHVKNAKLTDQALYRCVAISDRESVEDDVEALYVEIPSVNIDNKPEMVQEGDQVVLKCVAYGIPNPKIKWLWKGMDIEQFADFEASEDGLLKLSSVNTTHSGQVDCIAQNLVGEAKDSLNLIVGYPPKVIQNPSVLQLRIEGSGILLCNGSGVPNPDVLWERQDGKVIDHSRIQFDVSSGTLLFSDAKIEDEGKYLCIVQNKFGQVFSEARVEIIGVVAPAFKDGTMTYQVITTSVGEEVELPCNVLSGSPAPLILWFKDNNQLDSMFDSNIKFEANGSLKIIKLDPNHSGTYRCDATNVGGSISRIIELSVMDAPTLENSEILNLTEKVGNNALLPCLAHGTPQPDILWQQSENGLITLTERILNTYEGLVIVGVELKDAGEYTCMAVNPAGSANRSIYLTVQDPPHIWGETVMELVANIGDVVRLPCDASGEPPPEYVWSHNYEYLIFSNHILPSTNSDGLVITSVDTSDSGEYLCSAINDAGSANKTISLTVQEPPFIEASTPALVIAAENSSAKLVCKTKGIPEPRIVWTFRGQPVLAEVQSNIVGEYSLVLPIVQENDSGTYICTSFNAAGSDARAVKLIVQVMPKIEIWKDSIRVIEGQDLILDCLMHGIPPPEGSWYKDGSLISTTLTTDNYIQYRVPAKLSDAGIYKCEAVSEIGNTSRVVDVQILAPPRALEPSTISVKSTRGQKLTLECLSSGMFGYPISTINWTFNGDKMNNLSSSLNQTVLSTLYFEEIDPSRTGIYTCEARNEAGSSSRTFNVSVVEPPYILEDFLESRTLMEGEDLSLPCSAKGIPKPQVAWFFNSLILSSKMDYANLLLMDDNTLVIISAQSNTSGLYSCVAHNEVGEDKQQTYVEVYVPPSISGGDVIHEEVKEGENILLTCPSSDATEIEWKQNGEPIDFTANERSDEAHFKLLDGSRTLAIFESRPTDNGTYTCIASNPVGSKKATFYLEVVWAPFFEEFGVHEREFSIIEGNTVSFDCSSSGSPTPMVIWKINETLPVTERTAPGVVVLPSSRHMLTIPIVRAHHDGLYQCQAINRVGLANKRFLLHVIVPPYLEDDTEELYEVLRESDVTLVCPVKGSPQPVYEWSSNSNRNNSKVKLEKNSQIMIIQNVDFPDGGIYTCNGSNQAGFQVKHFAVSIMGLQNFSSVPEAPSIVDSEIEEEINVVQGGILSLDCTAYGQPLPDMQWTHNGHMLPPDYVSKRYDLDSSSVTQTLTTDFNSATLSGKYACHATNNRGAANKVFKVHIQVPPSIDGENQTIIENITSIQGLPFSLHCVSIGEPRPTISWFQNGMVLKPDVNLMIDGRHGETLHFKHSYKYHSGNFSCEAKNNAGAASKIFLLDVLVPPYHPNNLEEVRKNVLYRERLVLNCEFEGHPSPKLVWIKGVEPVPDFSDDLFLTDSNHTLVIPSVDLSHAGRYSCLAYNEAGSAELMFHVKVSEPPSRNEAVTRNYTLVTLRPLRRFMLLCAMTGAPSPNIVWLKDGLLLENGSLNKSIQISTDGRQLHILIAHLDHEGLYQCYAKNPVGSESAFFQLVMDDRGDWGEWSDWSLCSVSCDFGVQERKRDCLTIKCQGESFETRPCFMSYCPVHGGWSNWTDWTTCEQQCGQNEKKRSRKCNNPEPVYGGFPCVGSKEEIESCHLPPCPVDGGWSDWSGWSKCSVTCGRGVQSRYRICNSPEPAYGGQLCKGYADETISCNEDPCLGWSDWSEWTPCSTSCGPGMRQRHRKCSSEWSNCFGDNKQFEYCKLRRCVGDVPRRAHLYLHGTLNGHSMSDDSLYADLSGDEVSKRGFISTKLPRIHKREAPIQQIVPLIVSPVSWNIAYEDNDASNGFSLTKGYFHQDSQVQFTTGQEIKMRHVGQGVDTDGQLKVDIEVIGEVPFIQPRATILVEPFSEDFVQMGPNMLYVSSQGTLSADGHLFPYSLNSTVSYNNDKGSMQYFTEKMSTDRIEADYDPNLQEMRYTLSSVMSQKFADNKCPEGFKLNSEQQHCEDVDECLDASLNKCHLTQICENLLGSYRCSCPTGFRALKIGSRCLDVNECLQEPPLCSHECRNIPGRYHCICPPGTFLLEDRHSCSVSPYWDDPDEAFGTSESNVDVPLQSVSGNSPNSNSRSDDIETSYLNGNLQELQGAEEVWSCALGLVWKDNQCQDQDECQDEPDICGEDETCLNLHKTFKCMYTPCGDGFERDPVSKDCVAHCHEEAPCISGAKVAEKKVFMAVTLDSENNQPGLDLIYLSVSHDQITSENQNAHTKYYFGSNPKGKMFRLRQEMGKCVLFTVKKLKAGKIYRIEVRGDTFSDDTEDLLFSTKFTTFLHILKKGH